MVLNHPLDVCSSEAVEQKAVEKLQLSHYIIDLSRRYAIMNAPFCAEHITCQVNDSPVVSHPPPFLSVSVLFHCQLHP